MSKPKGIQIGEGFVLSEENGYYKVTSVSKNFSIRVDNTLPFWGACQEAIKNVEFRAIFHDMCAMQYSLSALQMNQDRYNKCIAFFGSLVDNLKADTATDAEHDEALNQVKAEWNMKKEEKEKQETAGVVYYRPHRVKFEESEALKSVVKSLKDVEDYCAKNDFNPTDLKCEYYGEDARHKGWFDTFVISGEVNGERVSIGFTNGMLK